MSIARTYHPIVTRPSRPTLTRLILEHLAKSGWGLLDAFFPARYPEAQLWRTLLGLDTKYEFKRRTFSSLISQLRAQGLVERRVSGNKRFWRCTTAGKRACASAMDSLKPRPDGRRRIICFDIPEIERGKRTWLRAELRALGYEPLQKSVWVGTTPLPEDLIAAFDKMRLRDRVHILALARGGTIDTAQGYNTEG